MNIYDYHNEPTQLLQYDTAYPLVIKQLKLDKFWQKIAKG